MNTARGYTIEGRGDGWWIISPAGNRLFGPFTVEQATDSLDLLNRSSVEERGNDEQDAAREHLTQGLEPSTRGGGGGFGHPHRRFDEWF